MPDESMIAGDPSAAPADESTESVAEESLGKSSLSRLGMGGKGKPTDEEDGTESRAKEMPAETTTAVEMPTEPSPTEEMSEEPASNRTEVAVETPAEMEPSDVKPLDLSLLDSILNDRSSDTDIMQRTDAIVESIRSMRDIWESEPSHTWDEREWDVYQETLRLAEIWVDSIATSDTAVYIPDSFRTLLERDWYRESLQQAASGRFAELYPPEVFEVIVWPVRSVVAEAMVTEANGNAGQICLVDPLLRIGSRVAQWKIVNEAVVSRFRPMSDQPDPPYRLVIGRMEQVDEVGIVIRIEGLIP
jgi:hypothetical protein